MDGLTNLMIVSIVRLLCSSLVTTAFVVLIITIVSTVTRASVLTLRYIEFMEQTYPDRLRVRDFEISYISFFFLFFETYSVDLNNGKNKNKKTYKNTQKIKQNNKKKNAGI